MIYDNLLHFLSTIKTALGINRFEKYQASDLIKLPISGATTILMKSKVSERLNFTLVSCLLLGFLGACTKLEETPSKTVISTEQQLRDGPGVTQLSSDQLPPMVTGQVIYIPIYSEIYDFDQNRTFQLTATLSLRNTDLAHPIVVETVDYYDSGGKKVSTYLTEPIQLAPLASTEVIVAKDDQAGGTGANFIVKWGAANKVSPPVLEAIMISTISQQGMSFVSPGRVIQEK
ncbi:MAG: DUF3124 domain-containing protein [Cyanobacteria bacterium P01_G01_bin.49]